MPDCTVLYDICNFIEALATLLENTLIINICDFYIKRQKKNFLENFTLIYQKAEEKLPWKVDLSISVADLKMNEYKEIYEIISSVNLQIWNNKLP